MDAEGIGRGESLGARWAADLYLPLTQLCQDYQLRSDGSLEGPTPSRASSRNAGTVASMSHRVWSLKRTLGWGRIIKQGDNARRATTAVGRGPHSSREAMLAVRCGPLER